MRSCGVTNGPETVLCLFAAPPPTRVWGLEPCVRRATLEGHTAYVYAVALSADNRVIVSGSHDNTVR